MVKKIAALAALLVLLTGIWGTAMAAGILTNEQEVLLVIPNKDILQGDIYVEVKNTGDAPLQFTGGLFELYGKTGESIGSQELNYYDLNPEVLLPGETGFLYAGIEVDNASGEAYIDQYSLVLNSTDTITTKVTRYPAEAYFQEGMGEFESQWYGAAIVENKSDETLRDFYAAFALKDSLGNLLYVRSGTWASSGVLGQSRMEIRLKADERVVAYFTEKGIVPVTAEAIVFKTFPR